MLTREQWLAFLKPGDILEYRGLWIVRWQTWSDTGHTEWYLGDGQCATARAHGVKSYDFEPAGLIRVLRPKVMFDIERMRAFHKACCGQKYDWLGLVRVFMLNRKGSKKRSFCSEHVARCARLEHGGPELVNERADCDEVSPAQCSLSPHYDWWLPEDVEKVV